MGTEHYLLLSYMNDSPNVNTGLVRIRRSDGKMFYYDRGWKPTLTGQTESVMRWMGTVPTFANLPTNNKQGDVHTVLDENGTQYAWDGNKWNSIGKPIAEADLTWDKTKPYKNGEISYYNSQVYFSLADNNQGNNPETSGASWKKYYPSEATVATVGLSRIATDDEAKNGDDVNAFVKPNQIKLTFAEMRKLNQASSISCVSGTWYVASQPGIAISDSNVAGQIETSKDSTNIFYSQKGEKATLLIDSGLYYRFNYTAGTFQFIPFAQ